MSKSTSSSAMNDWFLSLPKGCQDILKDDKWMLAEAAFRAGMELGEKAASSGAFEATFHELRVDGSSG